MIDLYLLEELATFQKMGTLAKTAKKLQVTQPTVTRGMQKLETELGVQLFNREPNRIQLTKAGQFAAKEAVRVLAINENYAKKVQNFALSESTIALASNAPGPLIILNTLKQKNLKIADKFVLSDYENLLLNKQYTCLFLNRPINNDKITSIYLGTGSLIVYLNEFTELSSRQEVSFADINDLTFLVSQDIGIWQQMIQTEMPQANFLYQNSDNFKEIRNNSIFPFFKTNLSDLAHYDESLSLNDRNPVKISDPIAHQQFYACFLKENKKRLQSLIEHMQDQWAKVD